MIGTLVQTPLYQWHVDHGARMVEFAGYSMPIVYTSIVAEHTATRTAATFFDISHMGRLRFDGPDAARFVDHLVTRRTADMPAGRVRYALVTNEEGGVLDDVLVYHLRDGAHASYRLLVVNASNHDKIARWVDVHRRRFDGQVEVSDLTNSWSMLAVQGPNAAELLASLVDCDLASLHYYTAAETRIAGKGGVISRTGYTGEDGFELIVGANAVVDVAKSLMEAGKNLGIVPAGLGCRDTLRLEAGMPLYGHELAEEINPLQAGLEFAVALDKPEFIGRDALVAASERTDVPVRVGVELSGRRIPREGAEVFLPAGASPIGGVTSGTFSPTLQRPIAMAYIDRSHAEVGTELTIDVRGRHEPASVVALPFYRRPSGRESTS